MCNGSEIHFFGAQRFFLQAKKLAATSAAAKKRCKSVNKVDRREMRPLLALGVHLTENPKEKRINILYNKKFIL